MHINDWKKGGKEGSDHTPAAGDLAHDCKSGPRGRHVCRENEPMHQEQNSIERLLLSFSINENKIMYNIYKHTMSESSEPQICIPNSDTILNELKTIGDSAQRLNQAIMVALEAQKASGDVADANAATGSKSGDQAGDGSSNTTPADANAATGSKSADQAGDGSSNTTPADANAATGSKSADQAGDGSSNTNLSNQSNAEAETRVISDDTAIDVDGQRYIYGNIMRAFENMKNGTTKNTNNLSNAKLNEVYDKLKNAKTTVEVQNILREHNFEIGGKNPANRFVKRVVGGTRKPRMHKRNKTQRKRSKTIRKKHNRK